MIVRLPHDVKRLDDGFVRSAPTARSHFVKDTVIDPSAQEALYALLDESRTAVQAIPPQAWMRIPVPGWRPQAHPAHATGFSERLATDLHPVFLDTELG